MKIHLPNSAFLGNIDSFFREFDSSHPRTLELSANKKWISVHPVVLSMVAALGLKVGKSNIRSEKIEATSKHYFERMGLFKFLGIRSGIQITEHESAGRFIPITQVKNSSELTKFITDAIPLLHLEQEQAESIRYIISELTRNVLEHSQSKFGAILSAQYYEKSNTIRIGIADTGVGIKTSIGQSHPVSTDLEAIKLALTPGITGTTRREGGTEYNAGAGLFFIKAIAQVNRDFFLIYSGSSMYKLLKTPRGKSQVKLHADPFKDRFSSKENLPYWSGTLVGIDISLDAKKDFSTLLDAIRETYVTTLRERKKSKYRRPNFIWKQ